MEHMDPTTQTALVNGALLSLLRLAGEQPTPYALAQALLTAGMQLPQECKGAYVNGAARLFTEDRTPSDEWIKFRNKLQAQMLKTQALVQAVELLLQDWRIEEPTVRQLQLFEQVRGVDMTTGEMREG